MIEHIQRQTGSRLLALFVLVLAWGVLTWVQTTHAEEPATDTPEPVTGETGEKEPEAPAPAPSTDDSKESSDAKRVERLWARYWPIFAKRFYRHGDDYVGFNYDAKCANSRGVTASEATNILTRTVEIRSAMRITTKRIPPERGEVDAYATTLPDMRVGQYGYIHSWVVEEILGQEEMLVSQIWLIDREQYSRDRDAMQRQFGWSNEARDEVDARFKERGQLIQRQQNDNYWRRVKVIGFPTRSLTPGLRWQGPRAGTGIQIAVLGSERVKRNSEGYWDNRQVAVLIPAERLKTGLTEAEFRDLMTKRGMTPTQFVDLVVAELRKGTKDMEVRVVEAIQNAIPPEAPPQEPAQP